MMKFYKSTNVKTFATTPFTWSDIAVSASHEEPVLNPAVFPAGPKRFDRRPKKGISRPSQSYKLATLNCRSLRSASSQAELNKLMHVYNVPIICIQEHRHVHSDTEPNIVARSIGTSTIFTASAVRNEQNASVRGVAITINSKLLSLLESVKKLDERSQDNLQRESKDSHYIMLLKHFMDWLQSVNSLICMNLLKSLQITM